MTRHPFVSTPKDGPCSSCGKLRSDTVHDWEEKSKPEIQLSGTDGNVFAIIGKVSRVLKQAGQREQAEEFVKLAMKSGSYDEVLRLCFKYVEVS